MMGKNVYGEIKKNIWKDAKVSLRIQNAHMILFRLKSTLRK